MGYTDTLSLSILNIPLVGWFKNVKKRFSVPYFSGKIKFTKIALACLACLHFLMSLPIIILYCRRRLKLDKSSQTVQKTVEKLQKLYI